MANNEQRGEDVLFLLSENVLISDECERSSITVNTGVIV
jgi:hypothetical protein